MPKTNPRTLIGIPKSGKPITKLKLTNNTEAVLKLNPADLVSCNSYIDAMNRNRFVGASVKKQQTNLIWTECKLQRVQPITQFPVRMIYQWKTYGRTDGDNLAFTQKSIQDGLVLAGILSDDNQKIIRRIVHEFEVIKKPEEEEVVLTICSMSEI